MNSTTKIIFVLTLITIISGGILAVLDSFTRPKIEAHQEEVKNAAIYDVLPQGVEVEKEVVKIDGEDREIYKAIESNEVVGYAFQVSGGGFQSELVFMVSVMPDFSEIVSAKILSQVETPGLGTKIENDPSNREDPAWFMQQFTGLKLKPAITYVKNINDWSNSAIGWLDAGWM
jgi:electron transport complex protein RnfG